MIPDTLAKISIVTVMTVSAQLVSPVSTNSPMQQVFSSHEISLENSLLYLEEQSLYHDLLTDYLKQPGNLN